MPLADMPGIDRLDIRVRYALADLVSVLMVVRYADGAQYNAGLYSLPTRDWHRLLKPLFVGQKHVRIDDDTVPPRPKSETYASDAPETVR